MQEAHLEQKDAQGDDEKFMTDAGNQRAEHSTLRRCCTLKRLLAAAVWRSDDGHRSLHHFARECSRRLMIGLSTSARRMLMIESFLAMEHSSLCLRCCVNFELVRHSLSIES